MKVSSIPISSIKLDLSNPRIAFAIEAIEGEVPDQFVELSLGKSSPADAEQGISTTYGTLKTSIRAYKGLINPIIVKEIGEGQYLVVEGNTRVAIYRELLREDGDECWKTIPAVIGKEIDESHEHAIRLQAHLVGPRPWLAYAKGRYLYHLYNNLKWSITQILEYSGGNARKKEVEEYIEAYRDMHEHYASELQSGKGYSKFSAFVEIQKSGPRKALAQYGFTMDDFASWLKDDKINRNENVRQLPLILANSEARKRFLEHDAKEAIKVLDRPSTNSLINEASLEILALTLASRLRTESWSSMMSIIRDSEGPIATALEDCFDELQGFMNQMNSQENGGE